MLLRARGLDGVPEVLVQQREVSSLKVSREAFRGGTGQQARMTPQGTISRTVRVAVQVM